MGESALYVQIAWVMCDTYMHLLLSSAREFRREAGDNNGPRFLLCDAVPTPPHPTHPSLSFSSPTIIHVGPHKQYIFQMCS